MNWTIPILNWTIPILKLTIPILILTTRILNWTTPILNWKRYRRGRFLETDETVDHIISKIVQNEYKTRHDWVEKVISCELCKRLKFAHFTKWYTCKPESVPENEKHRILCYFVIQTDHLILTWKPDIVITDKKKEFALLWIMPLWMTRD